MSADSVSDDPIDQEYDGEEVEPVVIAHPFGAATSAYCTFSGPTLANDLDLKLPKELSDPDGQDKGDDQQLNPDGTASSSPSSSSSHQNDLRELGDDAVWMLSSAKVGNGVEQLRDNDPLTFWQSDGVLPHALTIQFHKMTRVSCVCLYLDQKLDESYSPSRISIRIGSGSASADITHDGQPLQQGIREMDKFDLEEPQGWLICHLTRKSEDQLSDGSSSGKLSAVRCHFVQVVILNSYQNGRDTHIRQVKIFGPRQSSSTRGVLIDPDNFTTIEMKQFSCLR